MRHILSSICIAVFVSACSTSSPEVRELAEKTAANVGVLSAQLERLDQNSREIAELRADNIARLHEANALGRARYEFDLELTKKAGGAGSLKLVDDIKAWRDQVETVMTKAEGAREARKAVILETQKSLDTKKKALSEIAQGLAGLANAESAGERAKFLAGFAKSLKKSFDETIEEDNETAKSAKALLEEAKEGLGGRTREIF